jgi:iron complex outermembrane receptor protein
MMKTSILLTGLSMLAIASPAYAQSAEETTAAPAATDDGSSRDGDIVVTALKRTGTLQDTAATIQVIEPLQIVNAQIADVTNVQRVVPSLQIYTSPLGTPALFLYGMGTSGSGSTFEQSVMPFFNGVPNGHARSMLVGTYDLSSIEVVKGTQSILGKNSSLGAIMVNTQLPTQDFEAAVIGRYEFEHNSPYVEGMVNVPVSDTLALRFAGQLRKDGGYIRNRFLNRDEPRLRTASGRASLLWDPSDNFTYSLVYQFDRRRRNGASYVPVTFDPNDDKDLSYQNFGDDLGPFGDAHDYFRSHKLISNATLDLNGMTLTAITGFNHYKGNNTVDVDLTPTPLFQANRREINTLISQELRLASDNSNGFNWLAGLYFAHDKFRLPTTTITQTLGAVDFGYDQITNTMSAFGQVFVPLTPELELSGGFRLTAETRKAAISNTTLVPGSYSLGTKKPFPLTKVSRSPETLDYSVVLKYRPTSNLTLYASYGQGSKSGGFDAQPSPAATYQLFRDNAEFTEEVARALEAGVKYNMPGLGYINLSGFHVRVKDFQASTSLNTILFYFSRDQRSDGLTLDAGIEPVEGLNLKGTVTYLDTWDQTANLPLAFAAKWNGSVSADYAYDTGSLKFGAGVGLDFRSNQFVRQPSNKNPPATEFLYKFGAVQRLNAQISVGTSDGRYELALLGRNLTDEMVVDTAYPAPFFSGVAASLDRPRTIALQLTARY